MATLRSVFSTVMNVLGITGNSVGGFMNVLETLRNVAIVVLTTVEVAVENWKTVFYLAFVSATYTVVKFVNQVTHFFTEVVPSVLVWFADNWKEILLTVGANTLSFFENLSGNVVRILKNIPALVRGEVNFGDLWTPVTDGFVNVIKDVPDIAERQVGELERRLGEEASRVGGELGGEIDRRVQDRLARGADMADRVGSFFDGLFEMPDFEAPASNMDTIADSAERASKAIGSFREVDNLSRIAFRSVESESDGPMPTTTPTRVARQLNSPSSPTVTQGSHEQNWQRAVVSLLEEIRRNTGRPATRLA